MKSEKMIIALTLLFASSFAAASECVNEQGQDISNQPEVFQAMIAKAENCTQAADLARACAWGSSLDVATTAKAVTVCEAQLGKLEAPKKDLDLLASMRARCNAHFDKDGGTLAQSTTAFCHLSAVEFIVDLF